MQNLIFLSNFFSVSNGQRYHRQANFTFRRNLSDHLGRLREDQNSLENRDNEHSKHTDDVLTEVYLSEILSNVRQILEEIIFGKNWEKDIFGNSENKTISFTARSNQPTERKVKLSNIARYYNNSYGILLKTSLEIY